MIVIVYVIKSFFIAEKLVLFCLRLTNKENNTNLSDAITKHKHKVKHKRFVSSQNERRQNHEYDGSSITLDSPAHGEQPACSNVGCYCYICSCDVECEGCNSKRGTRVGDIF